MLRSAYINDHSPPAPRVGLRQACLQVEAGHLQLAGWRRKPATRTATSASQIVAQQVRLREKRVVEREVWCPFHASNPSTLQSAEATTLQQGL
jgi:hypothetical protein